MAGSPSHNDDGLLGSDSAQFKAKQSFLSSVRPELCSFQQLLSASVVLG